MASVEAKRVLITGGGNGIGRSTAILLAANGARVAVADIRLQDADSVAAAILASGGEAIALAVDVRQPDQVAELISRTVAFLGGIDVLFTCAGGGSRADGSVVDLELDEFWRTIRVDLFGTLLCCRFAIPEMIKSGGGSVITISSLRAIMGTTGADAYTAAKGGVLALSRAMAMQWATHGIRVNTLAPGMVMTERIRKLIDADNPICRKMLLGTCQPEDVSELVLYLASDASRRVTGTVLPIDGGASIS